MAVDLPSPRPCFRSPLLIFTGRKQMASHRSLQSTRLLPAFVLLLVFLLTFQRPSLASDPRKDDCKPKSCGSGPNISYPFWIADQHPPYCGFPNLSVTCNQGAPAIAVSGLTFRIQDIDYNGSGLDRYLSLVGGGPYLRDHGNCTYPTRNLISEDGFSSDGFSSVNPFYYFINCTEQIYLPGYVRMPCQAEASKLYSYVGRNLPPPQVDPYRLCGSFLTAPCSLDWKEDDPFSCADALKNVFSLSYPRGDPSCTSCKESGGRCGYDKKFMCLCSDRSNSSTCVSDAASGMTGKKGVNTRFLGVLAAAALPIIFISAYFILRKANNCISEDTGSADALLGEYGLYTLKRFRYSEVKKITKGFSDKLGEGGYGSVFRGKLHDGRLVAVKLLSQSKGNGEDFMNEVASIGMTYHINVVTLIGFCSEGSERALVYDYMPNGSLEKFVFGKKSENETPLGWEKLYTIALGIARGLEYLHKGSKTPIVHFDIKPHNILLDEDFCPKISDFGLAKLCPSQESKISMVGARGTIGYIAPEVFSRNFGTVSTKSDVYSYGMMVLEMVGGRKNADARMQKPGEAYYPHWIYDQLDKGKGLRECGIPSEFDEVARKMILVGLWCIQTKPATRPSMTRVVEMLEGNARDVEMPPKPYICSPSSSGRMVSSVRSPS